MAPSTAGVRQDFTNSDFYAFAADFHGVTRLTQQHYIWRESMGFNIHPSIPVKTNATVAEVACGTALWLIEVAGQLGPASDLHGFDINLHQAPAKPWLPKNMKLHKWNFFDEVPEEFVGKFDLVHVRLITIVIKDNDPRRVVQNLCKLLKPGGYLQWDEVDVHHTFVAKAYPDIEVPALDAFAAWMSKSMEGKHVDAADSWQERAVDILRENGFETAKQYHMKEKCMEHMALMRYNSDQLLMLFQQYAVRVYTSGHQKTTDLLKLIDDAAKDADKGAIVVCLPMIWVARKAA